MPRKQKEIIWNYFDNNIEQCVATCKICKHTLKNDRAYNLKTHLLKMHKVCVGDAENSFVQDVSSSNIRQIRKKKITIEINKKQLLRAYIGLVTEDSIPFRVLNSQNMRYITDAICKGLSTNLDKKFSLNSANCKKSLKLTADNIRCQIKTEVSNRLLSLKIDSASRLSRNIFGISAQFISNDEIISRILGMVELKGASCSTSKNLATEIIKTLTKYGINLTQIVSITSDNGANMVKATKMLSQCSICNEDLGEFEAEVENDTYINKISMYENAKDEYLGEIQICRCAAHTAQLCALDVTKDKEIKKFLFHCRNLTKFLRKTSNGYREVFELKCFRIPQLDCPTRWGSTYKMIYDLKTAKDVLKNVESIRNKSGEENFDITDSLWDFIDSYCNVFEPLQKSIVKFQEEQLHYGNFYAQWLKCKIGTKRIVDSAERNPETFTHKIGSRILEHMETRTKTLLSNETLNACLYMDPRFHHTLTSSKKNDAVMYLKTLWDKLSILNNKDVEHRVDNLSQLNRSYNDFSDAEDEFLNEFLTQEITANTNESISVHTKIAQLQLPFHRADFSTLNFWKEKKNSDPELYALSNIIFAVPPTQVTIERAFSSLKLVLSDNRNRLHEETLENILLVKLNPSFLNEAVDSLPLFEDDDNV